METTNYKLTEIIEKGYKPEGGILLLSDTLDDLSKMAKVVAKSLIENENVFEISLQNQDAQSEYKDFLHIFESSIKAANEGQQVALIININSPLPDYITLNLISLLNEKKNNLYVILTKSREVKLDAALQNRLVAFQISIEEYEDAIHKNK